MKLQKSDTTLNEKDAIFDLIESEKQLMSFYVTALYEGSSKSLRKDFSSHLATVAENQYSLFNQLSARGYYKTEPAKKQMIDSMADSYKKQKKQLSK